MSSPWSTPMASEFGCYICTFKNTKSSGSACSQSKLVTHERFCSGYGRTCTEDAKMEDDYTNTRYARCDMIPASCGVRCSFSIANSKKFTDATGHVSIICNKAGYRVERYVLFSRLSEKHACSMRGCAIAVATSQTVEG